MSSPKMNRFEHLRHQVQSRIQRAHPLPDLSTIEIRALYHELQTHQAELELQNEQLQESEALLEQSTHKYRELFESIPIGYATLDSRGHVIDCNAAGHTLLQTTPGTSFMFNRFFRTHDADRFILLSRQVLKTKHPAECELPLIRSDHSHVVVSIHCFPVTSREGDRLGVAFQDVTLRVESDKTLRANQAELQLLTRRLFTAQEEARHKLAGDLHDDYGQRVTAMIFEAELLARAFKTYPDDRERIIRLKHSLENLLDDFRFTAHALQPLDLALHSLTNSMRHFLQEFGKQTNLKVTFQSETLADELPHEIGTHLYRVLQEAVSNVAKHARAKRVDILLSKRANGIQMVVTDDGRGFDLKQALQQHKGMGLISMQERVRQIGGRIAIESGSLKGTSIQIAVPDVTREKVNGPEEKAA
jgi:signal transduction histidine kinase